VKGLLQRHIKEYFSIAVEKQGDTPENNVSMKRGHTSSARND